MIKTAVIVIKNVIPYITNERVEEPYLMIRKTANGTSAPKSMKDMADTITAYTDDPNPDMHNAPVRRADHIKIHATINAAGIPNISKRCGIKISPSDDSIIPPGTQFGSSDGSYCIISKPNAAARPRRERINMVKKRLLMKKLLSSGTSSIDCIQ
jgi:hypothetical protein